MARVTREEMERSLLSVVSSWTGDVIGETIFAGELPAGDELGISSVDLGEDNTQYGDQSDALLTFESQILTRTKTRSEAHAVLAKIEENTPNHGIVNSYSGKNVYIRNIIRRFSVPPFRGKNEGNNCFFATVELTVTIQSNEKIGG